jgi:hypothetical protein
MKFDLGEIKFEVIEVLTFIQSFRFRYVNLFWFWANSHKLKIG